MICRCVVSGLLLMLVFLMLFLRPEQKLCSRGRWPRQFYLLATILSRGRRPRLERMEFLQEGFAGLGQVFFEAFRTIAVTARPKLGSVFVTTIAARMCVFR
jgi:hypothetical protein